MSALGRLVMVADVALEEIPVTLFVASRVPFIYMCVCGGGGGGIDGKEYNINIVNHILYASPYCMCIYILV